VRDARSEKRERGREKRRLDTDRLASRTIVTVDHEIRAGYVATRSLAVARILTRKCGRATLPDLRPGGYAERNSPACREESETSDISTVTDRARRVLSPGEAPVHPVALTYSPRLRRGGVCFRRRAISVWHIVTVCVCPPLCCQARLLFVVHARRSAIHALSIEDRTRASPSSSAEASVDRRATIALDEHADSCAKRCPGQRLGSSAAIIRNSVGRATDRSVATFPRSAVRSGYFDVPRRRSAAAGTRFLEGVIPASRPMLEEAISYLAACVTTSR